MIKKQKIIIIDTSAILSGKQISIDDAKMITTPGVSSELRPGGRDYRAFEHLMEKGLIIESPSQDSIKKIKKTAEETGDIQRLSSADIEILALAVDISITGEKELLLLTDDYSIQNVAEALKIPFQGVSQQKITKKFKWLCCCPGCGKRFSESRKICTICGTATKLVPLRKDDVGRYRR